jgi:carbon-monoxide dehydrogenase large subunit
MAPTTTERRTPLIGSPVLRTEDGRLLRGQGVYIDDVPFVGAVHIAFARSPHAHARIDAIDLSAALEAPGVLAAYRGTDMPGAFLLLPPELPDFPVERVAHPVMPLEAVSYAGQIVAAVVAETRAQAEDAAELIEVEYTPLDSAQDTRSATRVHESRPDNVLTRYVHRTPGIDAAFDRAVHIISGTFRLPRVHGMPMETRGAAVIYDAGRDAFTLWFSGQDPHRPREELAHALHRTQDQIRVIIPEVGGGFGIKASVTPEVAVTAHAAMKLGRPVKWIEDRFEYFGAAHQGRGVEADVELAIDAGDKIIGLRARIRADLGAFILSASHQPGRTAARLIVGAYDIRDVDIEMLGVATNRVPTSPYRGAGRPEAAIILEQLVDRAARKIGIDPIAFRRKNLIAADRFPYKTATGYNYDSGNYQQLLDKLEAMCDFPGLRQMQTLARLEGRLVGIGVGMYIERSGGVWESARVSVGPDGHITARIGACPHGQGHETTFAQIVGDALGAPMERITVLWGDSDVVPRGVGTFASRSTMMCGAALSTALAKIHTKATQLAAFVLKQPVKEVAWEDGEFYARHDRSQSVAFRDLATLAYNSGAVPPGFELGFDFMGIFASDHSFGAGVHMAHIEVDRNTGGIAIREIVAVDDAGIIINPLLAEGQVLGGIAQGIGEALYEHASFTEDGRHGSVSFLNYHLPTAVELPPVRTAFLQTPSPVTPLGAKGVGEGGACGTPAALANALADALAPFGSPYLDFPYIEENVWTAIHPESGIA